RNGRRRDALLLRGNRSRERQKHSSYVKRQLSQCCSFKKPRNHESTKPLESFVFSCFRGNSRQRQKSNLNPNCCCRFGNSACGWPNCDDCRLPWKLVKLSVLSTLNASQKPVAVTRPPSLKILLTRTFRLR